MIDLHLQNALHATSFAEQPISDNTLCRFRKRCYDYKTLHGGVLISRLLKNLSGKIAKIMKLNGRTRHMDSLMIESNIRFLMLSGKFPSPQTALYCIHKTEDSGRIVSQNHVSVAVTTSYHHCVRDWLLTAANIISASTVCLSCWVPIARAPVIR